jgi:hypothetical protein
MRKFSNPLVSIVILNWNGKHNLAKCLESLFKISYKPYEIVIVDNGSTDSSLRYIKSLQKKNKNLILVKNFKNLGFAEGNNIGYKRSRGELILLLNNDVIVEKDFLNALIKRIMSSTKIGAVQPKIKKYEKNNKENVIDSIGSYFTNSGFLFHFGHNKPDSFKYSKEGEIFSMKGACMLLKRKVIEEVGLFDSRYFAYFEETDLCQRIWMAGYKIYYIPDSVVYHRGGETAKQLGDAFIQFHSYKNRIYTYLKNFQLKTIFRVLPLHIFACQITAFVYLATLKPRIFFAIEAAILWNLLNLPSLIVERTRIQRLRRVGDSEYLPKVTRRVRLSYYYHLFSSSLRGYKD